MADTRHHAGPIAMRERRVEPRPVRRADNVVEQRVPFLTSGPEPHLMLYRRLDGRGAGVWQAADVLAMQRTVGNRATQRAVARAPHADIQHWPWEKKGKDEKTALAGVPDHLAGLKPGDEKEPKPRDKSGDAKDLLTLGGDALKTPADALKGFAFAHVKEDEDTFAAKPKYKSEVGDADTRGDLNVASLAIAPGGGLLAMGGGIAAIVELHHKFKSAKGMDRKKAGLELVGKYGQTSASTLQTGANVSALVSGGVKKADASNSTAGPVSTVSGGIGDVFGAFGAVFDMVVGAGKGVMGILKSIQDKKIHRTVLAEIFSNFLTSGKAFLTLANSAISAVSKFLTIAKTGAEFVQAVPFIGGAINIAVQSIDVLIQSIKVITQTMALVKARRLQMRMKEAAGKLAKGAGQELAEYLGGINLKRFKRAWIPLSAAVVTALADLVSVGASILNMVGTATSAAMGGGAAVLAVGYGLAAGAGVAKLGAGAMKPISMLIRVGKQKIRDAGEKSDLILQAGNKVGINMEKTSKKKLLALNTQVDNLVTYITGLTDPTAVDGLEEDERDAEVAKYTLAYHMIKAAGAKPKDLTDAEDTEGVKDKLRAAMLKRE